MKRYTLIPILFLFALAGIAQPALISDDITAKYRLKIPFGISLPNGCKEGHLFNLTATADSGLYVCRPWGWLKVGSTSALNEAGISKVLAGYGLAVVNDSTLRVDTISVVSKNNYNAHRDSVNTALQNKVTKGGDAGEFVIGTTNNNNFRIVRNGQTQVNFWNTGLYLYNHISFPSSGTTNRITHGSTGIEFIAPGNTNRIFTSTLNAVYGSGLLLNNIGGSTTIDANASLELAQTNKYFLPNRLTSAQRDLFVSPVGGANIFNTNDSAGNFYDGSNWYRNLSTKDATVKNSNWGFGTLNPTAKLHINENQAGREYFAKFGLNGVDDFGGLGNYTETDNALSPNFFGFKNSLNSRPAVAMSAYVTPEVDNYTGSNLTPLIVYEAFRVSNSTNPLNSSFSNITKRDIFGILNNGNRLLTVTNNGSLGVGTSTPTAAAHINILDTNSSRETFLKWSLTGVSDFGGLGNATINNSVLSPMFYGYKHSSNDRPAMQVLGLTRAASDVITGQNYPLVHVDVGVSNNPTNPLDPNIDGGSSYGSITNKSIFGVSNASVRRFTINADGRTSFGTSLPAAGVVLDINLSNGGLSFPQLTTSQRAALTPGKHTVVYDTTINKLCLYLPGIGWVALTTEAI